MQFTRNAKGTVALIIAVVCGQIWSAVSPVYEPPWEPWPPIVPFMVDYAVPFMVNYYRPLLIGLAGLAILWVWEGRRAGYLLALALAAIATVFGVSVTIFNTMTQEWIGLLTAVVAVAFPAVMALWYSFQGCRARSVEA